jgi:uncharacterized membrane protein
LEAKKRFTFIDLLKGWALLVMMEVHVVNAFIKPELSDAGWFSVLNFINGLVAPSFTFISGFAFIISSKNNLEEMRKFGPKFWKKLSRILLLVLIGYSLHMPEFSFQNIIKYASPENIVKWYNVDVLQCIAISLLILFFSRLLIKSDKVYNRFILFFGLGTILISPLIWNIDFALYMPMPLACYFNAVHGSFFPLFPWMGFLFAGAYACVLYMKYRNEEKEELYVDRIMWGGLAAFAVCTVVLIFLKASAAFQIKPDPFFFLQRLGLVLLALGLCWKYTKIYGEQKSFVTSISRESLLIYFLHLQVIYRKVWSGQNLEYYINFRFGIIESICATLILITSMIAVAQLWGSFKNAFPRTSTVVIRTTLTVAVILFFYLT